jgi:VWFA-related protein
MDTKDARVGFGFLLVLLACVLAIGAVSLVAQQTFRATTVVVEVDAIVTDSKGQFVTDLTADDFEVFDEGAPQKIERVYLVNGSSVNAVPRPATAIDDVAAHTPGPPAPPQRVFVLVFDQEHMQEGAFKRMREAAITFLTNEFRTGDVGGVVIGSAMAGNQLTSDRDALLAAVRNAKPSAAKTSRRLELFEWPRLSTESEAIRIALSDDREVLAQAVRRACQDDSTVCKNGSPEPMVMEKARSIVAELRPAARRTVVALQALASGLGRLPGRKTIILMTEGFFIEESWADLRQIVGAAARSNVRVYSLDARGLDTRQANDLRQLGVMDAGGGMPLEAYNTIEDGPNTLAIDTGGYPIRRTNTFADALAEIARDTSRYYVLGYSPSSAPADGSFRRLTVRVKRQGVKVRARRGYLATAPAVTTSGVPSSALPVNPAAPSSAASGTGAAAPASVASVSTADRVAPSVTAAATHAAPAITFRPDTSARVRELASREPGTEPISSAASQGWNRYQQGDLEGAAEWLGKAVSDPNARPWVHYALGYSELALRHPDKAAQAWETVRAAVPEFRAVYLDLADAYLQMENFGRAIDVLRSADARWPGDVDVLNATGAIQVHRGALNDAITMFKKATESNPDDALGYFNLGRTYELRYLKTRHYSQTEARWLSNPADIKNAIASYEQCLKTGGPYESQARESILRLQWIK